MIGKLLIVDDEKWFREGMIKLISSNQLGWEVVGEASDGEEALAAMEICAPDLVITDINMPVMDGLALTEWLSENSPEVMVIILTGYREFEYAQRALRYGAVEFLLKPFSLDEAYRVLRKAYEKFRLRELQTEIRLQEQQVSQFRAAVYGLPQDRITWEAFNREWSGLSFCILKIASYQPVEKMYTEKDAGLLHYAVSNILTELLQRQGIRGLWCSLRSTEFAFLLDPGPGGGNYRELVTGAVNQLLGLKGDWLEGQLLQQLDGIALIYQGMGSEGRGGLPPDNISPHRSRQLKEEILSLLITSNLEEAELRIAAHLRSASLMCLQECKTEVYILMTAFSDILMTDFKHLKAAAYEDLNPAGILNFHSVSELLEWAEVKGHDFIGLFTRWMQEKQDNVVLRAVRYIDIHYREACTLQTVAAHVHVTPNYLSNLFKKETGIGFTNYVSQVRIEKAKPLLCGTRLKMIEIAEQTGFDNSSYFTTVFKQLTGKSPSEFRKRSERFD